MGFILLALLAYMYIKSFVDDFETEANWKRAKREGRSFYYDAHNRMRSTRTRCLVELEYNYRTRSYELYNYKWKRFENDGSRR